MFINYGLKYKLALKHQRITFNQADSFTILDTNDMLISINLIKIIC